ncbi:MAG: chemotaxis protein CheD [Eubacteriales bacterium]|nr:chemotaxis protein CheD [Eubacteriales bacterium]
MEKVVVGIGEGKIAREGQVLISYALGSCVGICLYDRISKIAGMAHIILPESNSAVHKSNPYKFADEGIRALINEMEKQGALRRRLTAKIAGGAKMFSTKGVQWEIGYVNVETVKKVLLQERVPILAEDTGKNYGRTIQFYAHNGKLEVRTVRHEVVEL